VQSVQGRVGWPGFISWQGYDFYQHSVQTTSGTHSAIYPAVLFSQGNHTPSSSAEVKDCGAVPSFPRCLHGMMLNELITGRTKCIGMFPPLCLITRMELVSEMCLKQFKMINSIQNNSYIYFSNLWSL
jgi:hypothetical protein